VSPSTSPSSGSDTIFEDGFETGDFSMWDSSVIDGGDLAVAPGAASDGLFGMQANIDDATPIYVVDLTPACEKRYRARFYFDPNSVVIASLDFCTLFTAYHSASTELIKIDLRYVNNVLYTGYQVRCYTLHDSWHKSDDVKSWRTTAWYSISDALHYFEFDWQAATAKGLDSGHLTFWIDGVLRINITDIDNDTRCVDWIALGITGGLDPGTSGVCFFDDFVSRRTTYIGA
jgi:hypothetical protein